ncbi:MAG: hypothetical protein ACKVX7_02190 [Planctomycetota bacterium]
MRTTLEPRSRWLFIVVSIVFALAQRTHADDSQLLYDRLLAPLRRAPTDENAVAQLSRWAADHGGIAPLAEHLERGATGVDAYLAGRFWEAAAAPARAFVAFERSLAAGDASSTTIADVTRLRLTRLCLTSRWRERAREVWAAGPPLTLPPIDRWEIEIRLHAGDPARIRELLAQAIADVPLETAAAWAIEEGHYLEVAALLIEKGRDAEAFRVYLDAADGWRADELLRKYDLVAIDAEPDPRSPYPISNEERARVFRLTGDGVWLFGLSEEERVRVLTAPFVSAEQETRNNRTDGVGASSVDNTTANALTPTSSNSAAVTATEPRDSLALEVLADPGPFVSDRRSATIQSLCAPGGRPSLAVCLALLAVRDPIAARREFALWQLEPNEFDRTEYLPRVWRQSLGWETTLENEFDVLEAAELLATPSLNDSTVITEARARLIPRLSQAILASDPGSGREAQLLYHRGRLSANHSDMSRAVHIAIPSLDSSTPIRVREPSRWGTWIRKLSDRIIMKVGPANLSFSSRESDRDRIVGVTRGRALRLSWCSGAATGSQLESWRMDPDPDIEEVERILGIELEPNRLIGANGAAWSAGALAPLTDVLRWSPKSALVTGLGAALLTWHEDHWREEWRLESPTPMSLLTIDPELKDQLGVDYELLTRCRPGPPPDAAPIQDFIKGARLRAGNPNLDVTAWIASPSGAVLRMADGTRAVFELAALAKAPRHREFPGYRATNLRSDIDFEAAAPAFWVREAPALEQLLPESGAMPPRVFDAEFRRVWQRSAPETTLQQRESWPFGPEPPARLALPAFLETETIVTELRTDQRAAAVTTGGHVLFWQLSTSAPRWIADLRTPLPGPAGFPSAPPNLWDDENSQPSRGPHLAGVTSAANTPRLWYFAAEDELVVLTDLVQRVVAASSDQPRIELVPTPHATRWTRFADVARTRNGALCLLPATTKSDELWIGADRIALPRTGAFDLEIAGEQLYVFGFADGEYWLAAQRLSEETPLGTDAFTLLPLPELPVETDRAFVRLCALGRWHDELLVLGRDLLALDTRTSPSSWRVIISARTAWPEQDFGRSFSYVQTPPTVINDELRLARPWGVVEGWRADP